MIIVLDGVWIPVANVKSKFHINERSPVQQFVQYLSTDGLHRRHRSRVTNDTARNLIQADPWLVECPSANHNLRIVTVGIDVRHLSPICGAFVIEAVPRRSVKCYRQFILDDRGENEARLAAVHGLESFSEITQIVGLEIAVE